MCSSIKRTPNFTESEKQLLIKICNKHKHIIESKKTDAVSWKEKEAAWKNISKQFNSIIEGSARTEKQLQEKYKSIKKGLRKNYSDHRTYIKGTGGGPYVPPPTAKTEDEKELIETIKFTIEGLQNKYDSDGLTARKAISPETVRNQSNSENGSDMIEVDWTSPSCSLWQTPKDPRLLTIKDRQEYSYDSDFYILDSDTERRETSSPAEKTTEVENFDSRCENLVCDKEVHESQSQLLNPGFSNRAPETVLTSKKRDIGYKVTGKENEESLKKSGPSRRRPILQKKKTVSSAGAKFELVAEKKLLLIEYQKLVAENQMEQDKKEHKLRMEILQLKKDNALLKNKMLREEKLVFEF